MNELLPNRALAIVAHPDDIEYFCGGTLAKWTQHGARVSFVVTTSGDKGSDNLEADIEQLIQTREREQRAGAQVLGIDDVVFLGHPDSELSFVDHNRLRGEYVRHIRRTQAEIILTHDPFVRLVKQHSDHRTVGKLALDAAYPISTVPQCYKEQILDEGLSTWQPSEVLLFGTDQANYAVDIAATLELKVKALQAHHSQQHAFAGGMVERLLWKAQIIGQNHGLAAAEEFLRVRVGPTLPEGNAHSLRQHNEE